MERQSGYVPAVLAEDPGSVPRTQVASQSYLTPVGNSSTYVDILFDTYGLTQPHGTYT